MRVTLSNRLLRILWLVWLVISLVACAAPAETPEAVDETETENTPLPSPQSTVTPAEPAEPTDWIRQPAVAGDWYPEDPQELAWMVGEMLNTVTPVDGEPIGLILPHAAYTYSGPVVAHGFRQLEEGSYKVAVIIGSDHQDPLSAPISVWTEGGFETPFGVVPVDAALAQALVEAHPLVSADPAAHEGEHAIEIQLPFLQQVCPDCAILPILMDNDDEETVLALSTALLSVLPSEGVVVIASSDLSHYPTYNDALVVDGFTLEAIETGNPLSVRATVQSMLRADFANLASCACGLGPILTTMRVAGELGADTTTILRYANSGDSPYGDKNEVVGYGAVMFWDYTPPDLTEQRRDELLRLARAAIADYVQTGNLTSHETDDPVLARRSGVFVTLALDGETRGSSGRIRADRPLYEIVPEQAAAAAAAATAAPQFPPLTLDELDNLTIEISVLSPLHRMIDFEQIRVGTHGLALFRDGKQGLLLPHVPVEQGWEREGFLEQLCLEAQLPPDCWTENPKIYAFTAITFE